jgi:hypothetical protein
MILSFLPTRARRTRSKNNLPFWFAELRLSMIKKSEPENHEIYRYSVRKNAAVG